MRIISGHDYYDSALAYGQDDIVFVRKTQTFDVKECPLYPKYDLNLVTTDKKDGWMYRDTDMTYRGKTYNLRPVTLYFTGKRYGGISFKEGYMGETRYIWHFDKFKEFVESREYHIKKVTSDYWLEKSKFHTVEEWFNKRDITNEQYEWLIENKITTALYDSRLMNTVDDKWYCNCAEPKRNLKEYGFATVMPPYEAFQEISMWVGGVLPKDGPPMVEITDQKIKAHKHGFDDWSFRKKKVV